jgi:hypothetical protein
MDRSRIRKRTAAALCAPRMVSLLALAAALSIVSPVNGQGGGGRGGGGRGGGGRGGGRGPAPAAKAAAPIDITGYWVSIVTEDWRYRMVTPPKGAFGGVPLNPAGRTAANAWDPAKDEAAGQQCKSYGAPAIMRVPGRFHIVWQDDNTLRIDTDAGTQTRIFHFATAGPTTASQNGAAAQSAAAPPNAEPSWQGYSVAQWESAPAEPGKPRTGDLKVVTTGLLPGYLRKNGVPYSGNTMLIEWYDRITAPTGDDWLVVSTEVRDPQYLTMPFITSTHFKKQPDATGFSPEACTAR